MIPEFKSFIKAFIALGKIPFWYFPSRAKVGSLLESKQVNVELGAGLDNKKEGWITLDFERGCDLQWNLLWKLPFPDNSVDWIHSAHVMEHFTHRQHEHIFSECYRVLKPGGKITVCVPNAQIFAEMYAGKREFKISLFDHREALISDCKMDWLNYMAYMDGHHFHMFDEENLQSTLRRFNFKNVNIRAFDPSIDPLQRKEESIFGIAEK